jgi:uncharacterized membrane protein
VASRQVEEAQYLGVAGCSGEAHGSVASRQLEEPQLLDPAPDVVADALPAGAPATQPAPAEPVWMSYWRRPAQGPATALGLLVAGYIVVFGTLTWRQQSNYGTFGFDMGIYDQAIWLMSRFRAPFDTIRGLNFFGQHVNLVTALFVPAYWLGAGPHFLYLVETIWMAAGAVPIWLLGRDRFANPWPPLALSAAYLLYPSVEWINEWMFHPDALIIAPLMFAYWLATRRRWAWFSLAAGLALSCKEDAGLAVFALGLVIWLRERQRNWGIGTSLVGAGWFFLCTKAIIPWANGGGEPFYTSLFAGYGNSLFGILANLVVHPTRWMRALVSHANLTYYSQLFWPVALVALLEPLVLVIGVPQLFVNAISTEGYTNDIRFYYTSIVLAGIFLATVEACAKWGRTPSGRRLLVGVVFAASLAANVAWSPSPISVKYHTGIWAQSSPRDQFINYVVKKVVPREAAVSATYDIDDHMTHRPLIFEFPNPWVPANWGLPGKHNFVDPNKVNWMVLDTGVVQGSEVGLLADLRRSQFRTVLDEDGILVLRRVRAGVPNDHTWP